MTPVTIVQMLHSDSFLCKYPVSPPQKDAALGGCPCPPCLTSSLVLLPLICSTKVPWQSGEGCSDITQSVQNVLLVNVIPDSLQEVVSDRISDCSLTLPTVISSCDPDYIALHRLVVRDTADPTVQTFLVLCNTVHQAKTKTALCWCNKRQQRRSNTSVAGIPPLDARGTPPTPNPSVRVCLCMCLFCVSANDAWVCVTLWHTRWTQCPSMGSTEGLTVPSG